MSAFAHMAEVLTLNEEDRRSTKEIPAFERGLLVGFALGRGDPMRSSLIQELGGVGTSTAQRDMQIVRERFGSKLKPMSNGYYQYRE